MRINTISVYGFGILAVASFLWGSFVYFRKSLESHLEEKIILDSVVLAAFWSFIFGRLVFAIFNFEIFWQHWSRLLLLSNYPGLDRWGVVIGMGIGIWLTLKKSNGKLVDWLDYLAIGVSAGMSVFFAGLALITFVWQFALLAVLYLLAFIYFWRIEYRYRTFSWYRYNKTSAKSGLILGLSIAFWGVLFLTEKILLSSFSWRVGLWAGMLLVGGQILVYIRSGRTIKDDLKIIFKNGKK